MVATKVTRTPGEEEGEPKVEESQVKESRSQQCRQKSLELLTPWETTFKNFYKCDDAFKVIFKPNVLWDRTRPNDG